MKKMIVVLLAIFLLVIPFKTFAAENFFDEQEFLNAAKEISYYNGIFKAKKVDTNNVLEDGNWIVEQVSVFKENVNLVNPEQKKKYAKLIADTNTKINFVQNVGTVLKTKSEFDVYNYTYTNYHPTEKPYRRDDIKQKFTNVNKLLPVVQKQISDKSFYNWLKIDQNLYNSLVDKYSN